MNNVMIFLLEDSNRVFTVSLALVLAFGMIEIIGLLVGTSLVGEVDSDVDFDASTETDISGANAFGGFFRWLGVGKVPLIIFTVSLLSSFGVAGLILNWAYHIVFNGALLHPYLSAPLALIAALPFIRILNRTIIRWFPSDHTNVVSVDSLIGLLGTVTVGSSRTGHPAEIRVRDSHGVTHLVRAVPVDPAAVYPQGSIVTLVKRDETSNIFSVTSDSQGI